MFNQKVCRFKFLFKGDAKYITDKRLDNYNLLKKKISELIETQNNIEK